MNKYGLVMPVYIDNEVVRRVFMHTLDTLRKTFPVGVGTVPCVFMLKESPSWRAPDFRDFVGGLFDVIVAEDSGHDVNSRDIKLADTLFQYHPNTTHVIFTYSDFVFNKYWLVELDGLIRRHPDAKAWSVYRSAYTRHHRILETATNGDVKMTMHDGLGCLSKEEWIEYKKEMNGDFTCPASMGGGCTIDIHHSYKRPGDYWATGRDYWQNIRPHPGIESVDCAIDFVGESI